jgi:copper homeostasis protein CutC
VVSPSPTPTPKILVDKQAVRIKVLNGSGVSGKASAVKEILKEKGYQEILTGNADSFDYEKTEVSVKKGKNLFNFGN